MVSDEPYGKGSIVFHNVPGRDWGRAWRLDLSDEKVDDPVNRGVEFLPRWD